jgi:quinol monooxygenase YgiN
MDQHVSVVVKVTARPDKASEMRAVVLKLARDSREEDGCIRYDVLQNAAEPHVFVLVEEWTSKAHLEAHNLTPHVHDAVMKATPLAAAPLDVGRYTQLSA